MYEDMMNGVMPRQRSSTKKPALALHKTSGSGSFLAHLNDIINMAEMTSADLRCYCQTFSCKSWALSFNLSSVGLEIGNWPPCPATEQLLFWLLNAMSLSDNTTTVWRCGSSDNFFCQCMLCLSEFIAQIAQSCREEKKWSGSRSVTNSSKFMSLKYLVATEIGNSCLECGNCWWSVQNQLIFQLPILK